jgi:hypothetical protein
VVVVVVVVVIHIICSGCSSFQSLGSNHYPDLSLCSMSDEPPAGGGPSPALFNRLLLFDLVDMLDLLRYRGVRSLSAVGHLSVREQDLLTSSTQELWYLYQKYADNVSQRVRALFLEVSRTPATYNPGSGGSGRWRRNDTPRALWPGPVASSASSSDEAVTQPRSDDSILSKSMPGSLGAVRDLVGAAKWEACRDALKRSDEHAWHAVVDASSAYAAIASRKRDVPHHPVNFELMKAAKKDLRDFVLFRTIGQTCGVFYDADQASLKRTFKSGMMTTCMQRDEPGIGNIVSQLNNSWIKMITAIMIGKNPHEKEKGTGDALGQVAEAPQPVVSDGEEILREASEPQHQAGGPQHVATGRQPFSYEASAAIMGALHVPTMPRSVANDEATTETPDPQDTGRAYSTTTSTADVVSPHHIFGSCAFSMFPDSRLALRGDRWDIQFQ